jgi:hypothetical protein
MIFNLFKNNKDVETLQPNSFWVHVQKYWEIVRSDTGWLTIFILSVLIVFFISAIVGTHRHNTMDNLITFQNKHTEIILRKLNDINATLHDVSSKPANAKQQAVFQSLENEILNIQQSIVNVAKGSDIKMVSSQIALAKDDIDSQLNNLKKSISESVGSKQYLDEKVLPFHVISIDVIAGQSYVSIEYAHHILPLATSDLMAGWRVISADFDSGIAEFVNEKNQYVKVSLQGA